MRSNISFAPLVFSAAALILVVWVTVKTDQMRHVYAPFHSAAQTLPASPPVSPTSGEG